MRRVHAAHEGEIGPVGDGDHDIRQPADIDHRALGPKDDVDDAFAVKRGGPMTSTWSPAPGPESVASPITNSPAMPKATAGIRSRSLVGGSDIWVCEGRRLALVGPPGICVISVRLSFLRAD